MAVEADSVVVELIAQNAQFDAAAKASATNFQQSMAGIQSAGAAAEGGVGRFSSALKENRLSMNQSRVGMLEFQHIARGVSDQFATSGLSAQLFTSHLGELSEAVVLSGGAFGQVGKFLQGPWGIALTLATTVIAGLVAGHVSAGAAADKHRTAEETLTDYINGEKVATDALDQSLQKLTDQRAKGLETTNQQIRAEYDLAHATIATAEANKAALLTQLATEKAQLNAPNIITPGGSAQTSARAEAQAQVSALQAQIDALDKTIGHATALIDTDFTQLARNLSTNVGRVTDAFDKQLAALEARFRGTEVRRGGQTVLSGGLFNQPGITDAKRQQLFQELTQQEGALTVQRQKAIEAARKLDEAESGQAKSADKAAHSTGEFGRQIDFAQAAAIAKGAGLAVTSGYRSEAQQAALYNDPRVNRAGNPVARPGTSAHEGINGKWALDIAFAPGLTAERLKKLYGDQGVSLSAVYKESGHYHIEGRREGAAAAGRTAAQPNVDHQEDVFQAEMARLNAEFLQARRSQVKDELVQADFAEQEVVASQAQQDATYQAAADSHRITQAQADQLKAINATVAAEKIKALEIQKQAETIKREDDAAERSAQYREDSLRAAEQAATSQQQRRDLDLQILDILYNEKLAHLERLKLIADGNGEINKANDLQAQIDQLPSQKAADRASTLRGTMDPLQAWLQSVPHDAQAVTEALQGIATNGFDEIASSIAGVVAGTETLGQAFGNIAKSIINDIVQMTIKMLIFRALSSVFGLGGIAAPDLSLGSQVDLGGTSSLFTSAAFPSIPSFAGGGFGVIGGNSGTDNNLLSLNGRGVAWVSNGEGLAVIPSNARAASPGGGGTSVLVVKVEANDERFDAYVESIAGPLAAQAGMKGAFGGAAIARNNLARRQLHQLGSRG